MKRVNHAFAGHDKLKEGAHEAINNNEVPKRRFNRVLLVRQTRGRP
jgi:hypothetical protein